MKTNSEEINLFVDDLFVEDEYNNKEKRSKRSLDVQEPYFPKEWEAIHKLEKENSSSGQIGDFFKRIYNPSSSHAGIFLKKIFNF